MAVLRPQSQIAARYELLDRVAAGTLGDLWRAQDHALGRSVALKVVRPELAADPVFRDAFVHQARAWAAISHPGAVLVFDFGEQCSTGAQDGPGMFLVLELVEGRSLGDLLARHGPATVVRTLDIVAQAASTLHAAHLRGVVHGNLKPSNLLLRQDGVVKVTDFGVAHGFGAAALSDAGAEFDSSPYRSPEQLAGGPATVVSDLYSLGVVAHLCLSGELPFAAGGPAWAAAEHRTDAPRPLADGVPAPVADLVRRLLDEDPAGRPADGATLAAEAVDLCRRLGTRTTRPPRELLGADAIRLVS